MSLDMVPGQFMHVVYMYPVEMVGNNVLFLLKVC